MANPFHIDLIKDLSAEDIVTDPINIKAGANGLFLSAVLDGAIVRIEQRPKGGTYWYSKPAGTFTDPTQNLFQAWDNTNLAEGEVRAVVTGATANTVIHEFLLRPTTEIDLDL